MRRPRTLAVSIRVAPSATIVDLEGAIDIGNSRALRTTLFETVPTTSRLALNMSGIRYIDSAGIATLLEVHRTARDLKKDFVLFGLAPKVYDVLKLTNLLGVFRILESEERALGGDPAS